MNLTWAYIFLVIAIIFELISTSILKDTYGFTKLYPSLIVVIGLCICLYLISHSMQFIPVGIVYASWAAGGIVGITIIAAVKYNQIPRKLLKGKTKSLMTQSQKNLLNLDPKSKFL